MNFFITGGSRGIGAAIVLQAIREGHDVASTYLSNQEKSEAVVAQAHDEPAAKTPPAEPAPATAKPEAVPPAPVATGVAELQQRIAELEAENKQLQQTILDQAKEIARIRTA